MRIAVNGRFIAARTTGVQRVARRLVAELAESAEVALLLPRGGHAPPGLDAAAVPGRLRGVTWEQIELPARSRDGFDVSLDPANAGPLWGGPRVLVLSDVFPITHPEWYTPAFRGWFRLGVVGAARRARRVIMFSEAAKREAVAAIGLPAERVVVATQGTSPFDSPAPRAAVDATLARFDLAPGFLLATGAGDPRKNLGFLHDVIAELDRRGDRRRTLVVVGAPYEHILSRTAIPPSAPGRFEGRDGGVRVRRIGFVTDDELHALYTAAAAFCFPSLGEGFGRPPLEAMACGTPVLAADYASAPEVLGDAALVLPLEPATWADALEGLLTDHELRRRRVEQGRAHAATFRWERAGRQVLEACREAG